MDNRIYSNMQPLIPINDRSPLFQQKQGVSDSFNSILCDKINDINEVRFSKHAQQRMQDRQIELTLTEKAQLYSAIYRAQSKGIRSSLILMQDKAFIVNIADGTVITAIDQKHLKDNVFTNIDGAVIV